MSYFDIALLFQVRSSRVLSLSNSFRPSPSSLFSSPSPTHHHHKKSRSSENISPSGIYASSQSPFSFSLSTPKSSLTSFKFSDKSPSLEPRTKKENGVSHQEEDLVWSRQTSFSIPDPNMKGADVSL